MVKMKQTDGQPICWKEQGWTFMATPGHFNASKMKQMASLGSPIKLCWVGQDEVLLVLAWVRQAAFAPWRNPLREHRWWMTMAFLAPHGFQVCIGQQFQRDTLTWLHVSEKWMAANHIRRAGDDCPCMHTVLLSYTRVPINILLMTNVMVFMHVHVQSGL